ncbi:MAG: hypothetical protein ACYDH9_16550 [Limisphaerales bacterium]
MASLTPASQAATNLILDDLHVQWSHLSAVGLFDADGDFTAEFLQAESLHVL